jgi:hypothetical protein
LLTHKPVDMKPIIKHLSYESKNSTRKKKNEQEILEELIAYFPFTTTANIVIQFEVEICRPSQIS